MNKVLRRIKVPFLCVFCSFAVSSIAMFLIPFMQGLPERAESVLGFVSALVFWLGIVFGCVSFKYIDKTIHQYIQENDLEFEFEFQKFPGVITFTKKPVNIFIYLIICVGVIFMVSDMIFHYVSQYVMFPVISIVFFSFVVHCITDGLNYKFYKKIRKECLRGYELRK